MDQSEISVNEAKVTMKLLELTQSTNYDLIQENGQRRLTAPEFRPEMRERTKGSEIFLGRLPRDCYEDEIMPILESVGHLLELRLMLDFSGSTRGYAFALFENSAIARRACSALDGYEIRPGHRIGVVKSIDNCRLFFGGVPKDKKKEEFIEELGKILDNITDIYLYPNSLDRTQNRGFMFVEFKDHRSAAMARRKLIPGRVVLWNHEIAVDWADPEPGEPIDEDIMETVAALFVRNLPLEAPPQQIKEIFQRETGIPILKLKKINHFAFIHYETRQLAENVLNVMTSPGGEAERQNWEIRWAKPIESCKAVRSIKGGEADDDVGSENHSKPNSRRPLLKRRQKPKPEPKNQLQPENRSSVGIDYQKIVQNFVAERFNAVCHYKVSRIGRGKIYSCEATVATATAIVFRLAGIKHQSKEAAIENTARELYERLRQVFENDEMMQRYEESQNWINSFVPPQYNDAACR